MSPPATNPCAAQQGSPSNGASPQLLGHIGRGGGTSIHGCRPGAHGATVGPAYRRRRNEQVATGPRPDRAPQPRRATVLAHPFSEGAFAACLTTWTPSCPAETTGSTSPTITSSAAR